MDAVSYTHLDENNHNVTYENGQARERTQIVMDIANQTNGMVIGTGDMSELALGWATYNGDQMCIRDRYMPCKGLFCASSDERSHGKFAVVLART